MGRALPASPDHRLRGTRLPLGERARVLRKTVGLVEHHLVPRILLCGASLGRCCLLLPLGGRVCAGLSARPFFAARHKVMLQLPGRCPPAPLILLAQQGHRPRCRALPPPPP